MRNYRHTAKGLAVDNPVVGTWRLKSFVREIAGTGERYNQLGEHPQGFLGYSSDGRMYAILVAGDRIKPQEEAPTDEERIKLHKSMMAYAGTYTIDGGKVSVQCEVKTRTLPRFDFSAPTGILTEGRNCGQRRNFLAALDN